MQITTMIKNQLKLLFNNRIALIALIAAPLLLTFLFSFAANNSKASLFIADKDNSSASKQLISMIKAHKDIDVVNLTEDDIKKKIDNNSIDMGFVIDKNFGIDLNNNKQLDIKKVQNYASEDGALLEQIVLSEANTLKKVNVDSKIISSSLSKSNEIVNNQLLTKLGNSSNITTDEKTVSDKKTDNNTIAIKLIRFLVMFLWFVIIQGFRTLIDEKNNNTFERILSTPTNYTKYLISKIVATYTLGIIITAIVLIAGNNIFNINLIPNLPAEAAIFGVYILALTGIIMIFVPFIKKQQTFTILGGILMALTGILGGSFFSIDEIASNTMKIVSKFTPESWAIKSINDVAFTGMSITSEIMPLIILGVIGVIGLLTSYIIITAQMKSERV